MSMNKAQQVRDGVRKAYSAAAERPQDEHPFPVGRRFAESLGYPQDLLASLPSVAVDAFSGVSNVALLAEIPVGSTVLDLGCGAGLDSLIAVQRVGSKGRVIGVDFSAAMLARARQAAAEAGVVNVEFYQAEAEKLPIEDGLIDVALVNGIFNLNPERQAIFCELARVAREEGAVYAAELILDGPLPSEIPNSKTNWFA
jgi:ubiquinone/menaquinone biosynthesis C-methylase UbiE